MLRFTSFNFTAKKASTKYPLHKTAHPRIFTMDASLQTGQQQRGVAVLIGWLYGKPQTIAKYGSIYAENGFESVIVACDWRQLLRPDEGRALMQSVEDEVNTRHLKQAITLNTSVNNLDKNIVTHAFSMGAYMTSLWLDNMRKADPHHPMLRSIKGQMYDSLVDAESAAPGIARACFSNPAAASILEAAVVQFLNAFPKVRDEHYAASHRLLNEPIDAPSQWFYSAEDYVSPLAVSEKFMKHWGEKKGMEVSGVVFSQTKHVSHMQHYPEKYRDAMEGFLNKHLPPKQEICVEKKSSNHI